MNGDLCNQIIERAAALEREKGGHLYMSALQSFYAAVKSTPGGDAYYEALTSDEVVLIVREIRDQAMAEEECLQIVSTLQTDR